MTDKPIKLSPKEIQDKKDAIEEYEIAIAGNELQIPSIEKEIELDLPAKKARINAKKQLAQIKLNVSNYKKEKAILIKQLEDWK